MKQITARFRPQLLLTLLMGGFLGACTEIVYRDRPLFEEPVTAAAGFVGYSDAAQRLTVCGNCHVSAQRRWVQTAHADAWAGLQASPAAQQFCEACHTTNARGNIAEGDVGGWLAHRNVRYHDVQCESCHGPGLDHVRNPVRDNWPLAPLTVGQDLQFGCGECHSGAHHPFVQEWAASGHAMVRAAPAGNPACASCHRGQATLETWGVRSEYLEKRQAEHLPITCGVCHDPHGRFDTEGNLIPGQLRLRIDVASEEENLCVQCHQKRGNPDPTTFRGPHSPEGPMLLGYGGHWFPPMEDEFGRILVTHGSERNPRLCAGCHVNQWEVRDQLTNAFVFRSTGHTFEATPCVDAQGIPTGTHDCALQQRTFRTCTEVGCHASESGAQALQIRSEERIVRLTNELDQLLTLVQPNWKQCRTTGNCPGTEFHGADNRWTVGEGAAFNYEIARFHSGAAAGQLRPGSSVHNPVLMEVLLIASIREVRRHYNLPAQTSVSLERAFSGK